MLLEIPKMLWCRITTSTRRWRLLLGTRGHLSSLQKCLWREKVRHGHWVTCFPRWLSVTCFPALGISYMFSRAWYQLHVFPRLVSVTCFPVLGIGNMFSRAWCPLYVFPRLVSVTCFPALRIGYTRALKRMGGETSACLLCDAWCGVRLGRERSRPKVKKNGGKWSSGAAAKNGLPQDDGTWFPHSFYEKCFSICF